jgi:hypothetical protein
LPYFLHIAAMLCCSEDEDFLLACGPPIIYMWCGALFRCVDLLVL